MMLPSGELVNRCFTWTNATMFVSDLEADLGRAPCHVAKVPATDMVMPTREW
jgi:hypothetical protein